MAKKKADTPRSFAHDSNARNSANIIRLRLAHGAAGYGVYFMLLERLRDSPNYTALIDYEVLAYDLRENIELIRSVIEDFGLFVITDDGLSFFSETLTGRLTALYAPKKAKEAKEAIEAAPEIAPDAISSPVPEPESEPEPAPEESRLTKMIADLSADSEWVANRAKWYSCSEETIRDWLVKGFTYYCYMRRIESEVTDSNYLPYLKDTFESWIHD